MERKHISITAGGIRDGSLSVYEVLAPVSAVVDLTAGYMSYIADISLISGEQLYAFAVKTYLDEVSAGGHEKFLIDPAGMLWREATDGMDIIGAEDAAENLRGLRDRFAPEPAFEQAGRIKQIEEGGLTFEKEDEAFRGCAGSIEAKLTEYIRANAEAFEYEGDIEVM